MARPGRCPQLDHRRLGRRLARLLRRPALLNSDTNPEGGTAQDEQPNLYLYEAETAELSFIATLAAGDAGGLWGKTGSFFGDAYAAPLYGPDLQGGGDGHVLAFASKAAITSDDSDGGSATSSATTPSPTRSSASPKPPRGLRQRPLRRQRQPCHRRRCSNTTSARRPAGPPRTVSSSPSPPPSRCCPATTTGPSTPTSGTQETRRRLRPGQRTARRRPRRRAGRLRHPDGAFAQDGDLAKDVYVARADGGFPEPIPPRSATR